MHYKNKNILIIMPFYFGYQEQIQRCLQSLGANIYMINEDVNEISVICKVMSIYFSKIYIKKRDRYYNKLFSTLPNKLDYVIVIKGSTLSAKQITWLKEKYADAKFILYQWDSVKNYPNVVTIAEWFDKIYTFDLVDAQEYGWKYRALFFDPAVCNIQKEKTYDLAFIGSVHSKRIWLLRILKEYSMIKHLNLYAYLFSKKLRYIRQKYIKRNHEYDADIHELKFKPLSPDETAHVYDCSKCIIDYKIDNQSGLTMRTIESIGHKCKLVTNNVLVKQEDFYRPNNIWVYDINDFYIPDTFINSAYEDISEKLYYKYSIQGWLEEILSG